MKKFTFLFLLTFLTISLKSFSQSCELYAPNSFTPNGDGYNDTWEVTLQDSCYTRYECRVYNSYGSLIWESFNPFDKWQGNVLAGEYYAQTGLYQYMIIINGRSRSDKYIGSIKLIR